MLAPHTRIALLVLAAGLSGCSTARKADVLEARLRSQEDMLSHYQSEITRVKTDLSIARREKEDLRMRLAEDGQSSVPADHTDAAFRVAGIELSSLMTGGTDLNGEVGHDGLTVVLIPLDDHGELVKLPGTIEIEALDLSRPGGAQQIGHWTFDQREVHAFWHKGVIQSGYQFELPWQTPPQSDQILVHGRLSTANGRNFDTTLTVKIDPPRGGVNPPMVGGVQQASAENVNPFAVQEASANRPAEEESDGIIWADGEQPTRRTSPSNERDDTEDADANSDSSRTDQPFGPSPFGTDRSSSRSPRGRRTSTGFEFSDDAARRESLSVEPTSARRQRSPRPQPLGVKAEGTSREIPPPIEDWSFNEDWPRQEASADTGVRTSDSFTDETIPRYR